MRVLALEPYFRGSHRAFLEGWVAASSHEFTLLTLPGRQWKWRMRHGAVTFARETRALIDRGTSWDCVWCSDMLNLAEYIGLVPAMRDLPRVAYFHENQLTYPDRAASDRDLHYAYTNFSTCLAASAVWFNSAYHRDDFLSVLERFLRGMPDHHEADALPGMRARSTVQYPGIEGGTPVERSGRREPVNFVWVGRWEHDKRPEMFFEALSGLDVPWSVTVLGESFRSVPPAFDGFIRTFGDRVRHWGYVEDAPAYREMLRAGDVVVSTASHEFFGLGVVEAMDAGCAPLVPRALAYPEVLSGASSAWYHDGTTLGVRSGMAALAEAHATGAIDRRSCRDAAARYHWTVRAGAMDDALTTIIGI